VLIKNNGRTMSGAEAYAIVNERNARPRGMRTMAQARLGYDCGLTSPRPTWKHETSEISGNVRFSFGLGSM